MTAEGKTSAAAATVAVEAGGAGAVGDAAVDAHREPREDETFRLRSTPHRRVETSAPTIHADTTSAVRSLEVSNRVARSSAALTIAGRRARVTAVLRRLAMPKRKLFSPASR
jgi:hypothetical protein